jgi:hypothetical protein
VSTPASFDVDVAVRTFHTPRPSSTPTPTFTPSTSTTRISSIRCRTHHHVHSYASSSSYWRRETLLYNNTTHLTSARRRDKCHRTVISTSGYLDMYAYCNSRCRPESLPTQRLLFAHPELLTQYAERQRPLNDPSAGAQPREPKAHPRRTAAEYKATRISGAHHRQQRLRRTGWTKRCGCRLSPRKEGLAATHRDGDVSIAAVMIYNDPRGLA